MTGRDEKMGNPRGMIFFFNFNSIFCSFQSGSEGYQQYNQMSPSRSPSGPTYTQLSGGSARPSSGVSAPAQGNSYHPPTTAQGNFYTKCT